MNNYVPLGDIVDIKGGGTPDKKVAAYWDGDIPWASVKDFKSGTLDRTVDRITAAGVAASATNIIPAGHIIVPTRMAVGKAAINTIDLAINQDLKALFPKVPVDTRYLYNALLANSGKLLDQATGATVKGIKLDALRGLKIPLPPLEEQKRIAGILDQADALRRLRTRALDKLNALGQAIFHEMVGETSKTSNGKVLLGDLLTFVTSGGRGWAKYYSDERQRFIRSLDVQMNAIGDDEVVFVNPPDNAEAKRTRVETGDVLLTITGSKIGRVAPVEKELDGAYISQHVAILRPDQNQLTPEFLSFFLSMEQFGQKQIKSKQYGQAKPGLNFQQIRSFELPKVPIEDQQSFVRRLHEINFTERNQTAAACANGILFASLQHRAFRGEL